MPKGDLRNIRVDNELWTQAKEVTAAEGIDVSNLIRHLLRDWLSGHTAMDVMSAARVAQELGVSKSRVHQLRKTAEFPTPLESFGGAAVWDAAEIREYNKKRKSPSG